MYLLRKAKSSIKKIGVHRFFKSKNTLSAAEKQYNLL
jgi:hypothetical protein